MKLLSLFKKKTLKEAPVPTPAPASPPPAPVRPQITQEDIDRIFYTLDIRVAGVTYKNGRRSRQTILRQIAKGQAPYDGYVDISFKPTEYDGEPAVEIWANEEMVGYIPKEKLCSFYKWAVRPYYIYDYDVYGGGKASDGSSLNYGMKVLVRFLREGETCDFKQLNPPML